MALTVAAPTDKPDRGGGRTVPGGFRRAVGVPRQGPRQRLTDLFTRKG
ncbi:hypothetical protein OG373_18145 [Streptomyces avidinii]|nr:hypothetical protein OG373_18145 [Streptomyces avidinii]